MSLDQFLPTKDQTAPERQSAPDPQAAADSQPGPDTQAGRRHRLALRLLALTGAFALLVGAAGLSTGLWLQHHYNRNIERFNDPAASIPAASRPKAGAVGAMNVLLLGSDSRISAADPAAWVYGAQRTDAIMIAHIPANRSAVTITSIPRDSWVNIPGHGMNKINAGFSYGGPALMVQSVEQLTGVRIDHVVIVDFDGFKEITDDLGGVQITVAGSTHDERSSFAAGEQTMDGETALNYVRQRHNLPGGDFDRVRRQQNWIRAVAGKTLDQGTLRSPLRLNKILGALSSSIAADNSFSIGKMRSLAVSLHSVRGSNLTFLTAPVSGTGKSPDGKQDIVRLNAQADKPLWTAMTSDRMPSWLAAHPSQALGGTVR